MRTVVTIRSYESGDRYRHVTHGMQKLALPDLVITGSNESDIAAAGTIINFAAQTLLEKPRVEQDGKLTVDLRALAHPAFVEMAKEVPPDAGRVQLRATVAHPDEGDPDNRLMEIAFDDVFSQKHDDEIEAAMAGGRAGLRKLAGRFQAGLKKNESLLVKAPFEQTNGNTEWMWIRVTAWNGDRLRGILENEPENVPLLKRGAHVQVKLDEIGNDALLVDDEPVEGMILEKLLRPRHGR